MIKNELIKDKIYNHFFSDTGIFWDILVDTYQLESGDIDPGSLMQFEELSLELSEIAANFIFNNQKSNI